jgi:hypothetical protein
MIAVVEARPCAGAKGEQAYKSCLWEIGASFTHNVATQRHAEVREGSLERASSARRGQRSRIVGEGTAGYAAARNVSVHGGELPDILSKGVARPLVQAANLSVSELHAFAASPLVAARSPDIWRARFPEAPPFTRHQSAHPLRPRPCDAQSTLNRRYFYMGKMGSPHPRLAAVVVDISSLIGRYSHSNLARFVAPVIAHSGTVKI